MKKLFAGACALYTAAWCVHLYIATAALRGFFGDGALAFLINVSQSRLFGQDSNLVHLFGVGFPRDTQLLLNVIGLQLAMWIGVQDPWILKYVFVFWQYALPGFLYLALFYALWRNGRIAWAIFPLLSWAVLSVPVEWASINTTRWAVPVFWMHFFLVLFAAPKPRPLAVATVVLAGIAMWGGLYESVTVHCALCLAIGAALWVREKNRMPFLFALAAVPGACRAVLSYIELGHLAPNNNFKFSLLFQVFEQPYFALMLLTLILVFLSGFRKQISRPVFAGFTGLIVIAGAFTLFNPPPSVWDQIDMRFCFVFGTLILMGVAALLRVLNLPPLENAIIPSAILVLLAGTVLWAMQSQQTDMWKSCRAGYDQRKRGGNTLSVDESFRPLFRDNGKISYMGQGAYNQCLWDWAQPWTDLLLSPDGKITQWPIYVFWQDFAFIEKNGTPYLHTNNWTLTSPSQHASAADLPLKTPLYDMTPLYKKLGPGYFVARARCVPVEQSGDYWQKHLTALDDAGRRSMFVCPRSGGDQ